MKQLRNKLKEAIKKKKQDLIKEKKISKITSKVNLIPELKEGWNKTEKDSSYLKTENIKLKEENKILKNKISDMISITGMNQTTIGGQQLNKSLVESLNFKTPSHSSHNKSVFKRKNSLNSFKFNGGTFDHRDLSLKQIPLYDFGDKNSSRKLPKNRYSMKNLNGSSFNFQDKKRSISNDFIIGEREGSCKYWETCKYGVWKKNLTYEPIHLINNRDLIKSIKWLAWDKNFETKFFISHCKNWRLTNGIPKLKPISKKSIQKADQFFGENLDNSLSSSTKNLFEWSKRSSKNRELIFNPDEDLLPISPTKISNQNEPRMISKIFAPNGLLEKSSSESTNKIITPTRLPKSIHQRKMTMPAILKQDKYKNNGPVTSEIEENFIKPRNFKKPMNSKELLTKINSFDKICNENPKSNCAFDSKNKKSYNNTTKNTTKSKKSSQYAPTHVRILSMKALGSGKHKKGGA